MTTSKQFSCASHEVLPNLPMRSSTAPPARSVSIPLHRGPKLGVSKRVSQNLVNPEFLEFKASKPPRRFPHTWHVTHYQTNSWSQFGAPPSSGWVFSKAQSVNISASPVSRGSKRLLQLLQLKKHLSRRPFCARTLATTAGDHTISRKPRHYRPKQTELLG